MGMHREVKIEYKKLKDKVKEYNKKDAKFYSNMLSKMLEPHVSSFLKRRVSMGKNRESFIELIIFWFV